MQMSHQKSVELYNIIDNDFATLKALYEEYKRVPICCFSYLTKNNQQSIPKGTS